MTLKVNESSDRFLSAKNYISVKADNKEYMYPFEANAFFNSFEQKVSANLSIKVLKVEINKKRFNVESIVHVEINNSGVISFIAIKQTNLSEPVFEKIGNNIIFTQFFLRIEFNSQLFIRTPTYELCFAG